MKKILIAAIVSSAAFTGAAYAQDSSYSDGAAPNPMMLDKPVDETLFETEGANATDEQFEGTVIIRNMYDEEEQRDVRRVYRVMEDGSKVLIAETTLGGDSK
ncbi:hypothetical protein [Ahrensia marina]|uniref:Uncharacterized protein n=1 Tax=Ahrensia marina TaxID=1514904 RepID=A0A0M9GLT3_9HYPH|nr:hypothetical protein [Ahrensia marina]KPB00426.1 hypothetical protein SU32_13900 [Ahrensia marina]